jgi:hypothetical protein
MSIGLPSWSLTFSCELSKLRTRSEILRFLKNGFAQRSPVILAVPT